MAPSRTRPPSSRGLDAAATTTTPMSFASSIPSQAKAPAPEDSPLISPATGSQRAVPGWLVRLVMGVYPLQQFRGRFPG